MIKLSFSLILPLMILSTGCSLLGQKDIQKPKVKLESVNVQNAGLAGATLLFGLNVDNPNGFPLKVDGLKYNLEVDGRQITDGELKGPTEVAANSASVIQVPIALTYKEVFGSMAGLLRNQAAPYRVRGAAKLGFFSIPFDEDGVLAFENGSLKARKK